MTYYERKMAECLREYNAAIEANDMEKQATFMREYLNYERMNKALQGKRNGH